MSPLTLFLAKFLGLLFLVVGIWMATHREQIVAIANRVLPDQTARFFIGVLRVGGGGAIVLGHNLWTSPIAALVTLVGWLMLINGLLTLFLPHETFIRINKASPVEKYHLHYAAFAVVLGLLLTFGGFVG